jgi:hypothetical protein
MMLTPAASNLHSNSKPRVWQEQQQLLRHQTRDGATETSDATGSVAD